MFKQFILWSLLMATAPFVRAQNMVETDSIKYSDSPKLLDEVVVKASPIINKNDRKVLRPSAEVLQTSADGIDLHRKHNIITKDITKLHRCVDF